MDLNLDELTLDNVGLWPLYVKIICVTLLFFCIVFFGYWFDNKAQLEQLSVIRAQQTTLLTTINNKQQQAANLIAYRNQLKEIDAAFKKELQHLPKRSEEPSLLEDISKAGLANGLSFKLFKPEKEVKTSFYSELPIRIAVVGSYHQLAQFISDVVGLDRIVTLHDFTIHPVIEKKLDNSTQEILTGDLILTITAKTYRYMGDSNATATSQKQEKQ